MTKSLKIGAPEKRTHHVTRWAGAGVVIVGLLTLAACLPVSGGGYISGANGSGKANFGFNVTCDSNTNTLAGPWNYNDKGAKVNIAGDMSSMSNPCSGVSFLPQSYASTYTVQGNCTADCTGTAQIRVYDSGNHGSMKGDCLAIQLTPTGDSYYSYLNADTTGQSCRNGGTDSHGWSMKPVLGGNLTVG